MSYHCILTVNDEFILHHNIFSKIPIWKNYPPFKLNFIAQQQAFFSLQKWLKQLHNQYLFNEFSSHYKLFIWHALSLPFHCGWEIYFLSKYIFKNIHLKTILILQINLHRLQQPSKVIYKKYKLLHRQWLPYWIIFFLFPVMNYYKLPICRALSLLSNCKWKVYFGVEIHLKKNTPFENNTRPLK